MTIREIDEKLTELSKHLEEAASSGDTVLSRELSKEYEAVRKEAVNLTAHDKVFLARHMRRPKVDDYIDAIFDDFFIQRGDYLGKEDKSIYGGIAMFHGTPVTVLGHRKGKNITENMEYNFGMPQPQGYRKALRLFKHANKFHLPIKMYPVILYCSQTDEAG